ncbi:type IV pili methyl-accepting chemotaxis transducer N-terminal domain-containing protein [Tenacibaculum sp. MEBiC06402]|uniref:type IV pili methyl-accepting chemotaxis transducer N-terminal domain-containing protein n=1 Tax=unclassified Tenacibaculum TaxID=2635139 RepID=UPI003B9BB30C
MNKITLFKVTTTFIIVVLFIQPREIKAQSKFGALTYNKAVNISGKQRMLTQKMAKTYLYLLSNPSDAKAKRDLLTTKIIFEKQNKILTANSKSTLTKNLINKVNKGWEKFNALMEGSPNIKKAKEIIDTNSILLKDVNAVVEAIILESKNAASNNLSSDDGLSEEDTELKQTINKAGKQRMLSQRLALYYFANSGNLKDKNNEARLRGVFTSLDDAITDLLISNFNNARIDQALGAAMTKWEQVKNNEDKLFKGGFNAREMYNLSNDLTRAFNKVTILYEKVKL